VTESAGQLPANAGRVPFDGPTWPETVLSCPPSVGPVPATARPRGPTVGSPEAIAPGFGNGPGRGTKGGALARQR
jgi:hypothetical protein